MRLFLFAFLLAGFCQQGLWADSLTGKVVIKGSTLPIKHATISDGRTSTKSDRKGRFRLDIVRVPFTLTATANGYLPYQAMVTGNQDLLIEMTLKTVIRAGKQTVFADRDQQQLSYYHVAQKSIRRLSEQHLFADTVSSLKMLPGVASRGSLDAAMYIRGGNAYEVVGMIDNIPMHEPYFWGGRISIFNSKIAKKVDFYPGGFDSTYGHSMSGIIDVHTLDGSMTKAKGEIDVSLTELNYVQSGPLDIDRSSYMLSYRRTYYDLLAPLFISSSSGPVNMPYLQSFQGKWTSKLGDRQKLKLGFYYFNDGADTPLNIDSDNEDEKNDRFIYDGKKIILSTQLDSTISKQLYNQALLAFYNNQGFFNTTDASQFNARWSENTFILRDDIIWDLDRAHQLKSGIIYYQINSDNTATWIQGPNPEEPGSVTINASSKTDFPIKLSSLYLQDRWQILDQTSLTAGLRWDGIKISNFSWKTALQPRVNLEHKWSPQTTLKAYVGQYRQFPARNQAVNRRVQGNTLQFSPADLGLELAQHLGGGVEHGLDDMTRLKVEGFYKDYRHLSINSANYPETTYHNSGIGKAGGVEVMLHKFAGESLTGWLTYTFSKTRRHDRDGWYTPDFDVTHMVNLYTDVKLSDREHLVTTIKYNTGQPYTPILSTRTNSSTGALEYELGDRFSKRLRDYIRIDVWYEWPEVELILPIPFLPISERKALGIFPSWQFKGKNRVGIYNLLNTQNQTRYTWNKSRNQEAFIHDFPRMLIFGYTIQL